LQESRDALDWSALPPLGIRHYLLGFGDCMDATILYNTPSGM
jgi:hypothetical protein